MLDVAIVVFYMAIFCAAFLLGSVRAIIMLLSLIGGLVGASVFSYAVLESMVSRLQGVEPAAGSLIAFVVAWFVVAVSLGYILTRAHDVASGRGHLKGAAIGGVLSIALLAVVSFFVASVTTVVMAQVVNSTAPDFSLSLWSQIEGSLTAQAALEFSPHLHRLVDVLTPGPAAAILEPGNG